jgi:hypothetical protein
MAHVTRRMLPGPSALAIVREGIYPTGARSSRPQSPISWPDCGIANLGRVDLKPGRTRHHASRSA